MDHLISQYGALGVFLSAAVEGQSAVVAGGLLACGGRPRADGHAPGEASPGRLKSRRTAHQEAA
ncbi:MAG: hypothetical protein Q8M88_07550 [Phenylobacterium sp.]|nr:hypothetical protein [Phenylobacterium sp.]